MARARSPGCRTSRRSVLGGLGSTVLWPVTARSDQGPVIAAAASLRPALDEIVPLFQSATGKSVRISYGATGTLVRQIELGGPFEAFLAADEESVARLEAKGAIDGESRVLVRGRIVLAAAKGSKIMVEEGLAGLAKALDGGGLRRFAIANPELAPYGRAAREALRRAGLWDRVSARLAVAENVGQAAQYVASGAADAGILAVASAVVPEVASAITFMPIPEDQHAPINQRMALLKAAGADARAFVAFLGAPPARALFEKFGFAVP